MHDTCFISALPLQIQALTHPQFEGAVLEMLHEHKISERKNIRFPNDLFIQVAIYTKSKARLSRISLMVQHGESSRYSTLCQAQD